MPVTKIEQVAQPWTPVEITMNFKNRDELAVFVSLLGSTHRMASELNAIGHARISHLSETHIENIIDDMIDVSSWNTLDNLVNNKI